MTSIDNEMKDALTEHNGFDPNRAHTAQEEVFHDFQQKLKRTHRATWLQLYLLVAVAIYAVQGFMMQASTTKGWVGYGMAFLTVIVIIIQKTILHGFSATQLVALREIKLLRLAVLQGPALSADTATKPLRGLSHWESVAWLCGLMILSLAMGDLSGRADRQDDLWHLGPQRQVEAHSVLSLRRLPHEIPSFYSLSGPVEGAVLQSARLNGRGIEFSRYGNQYTLKLPNRLDWGKDTIELVWNFTLPVLQDYASFRAPLHSLIPVHGYTLTLYVNDGSGFAGKENAWQFNKSAAELKNEAEARRTLKCFTIQIRNSAPRTDFGSCGLPIVATAPHQ